MLRPLIGLYFFIFGTIQLGLLLGLLHKSQTNDHFKPSSYWMVSLVTNVLALFIFGYGVLSVKDVGRPELNFTIANSLFYIAALAQWLFCKSLNQPISKRLDFIAKFSIVPFCIIFESLRQFGTFELRTFYMMSIAFVMFTSQLHELQMYKKKYPSSQLTYMQIATALELFLCIGRALI